MIDALRNISCVLVTALGLSAHAQNPPASTTEATGKSVSSLQQYPGFAPREAEWFRLLMNKQSMVRDVVKRNCMARRGFDYVPQYSMDVSGDFRAEDEREEYGHLVAMLEAARGRSTAYPTNDPDWMRAMTGGGGTDRAAGSADSSANGAQDRGCFDESLDAIVNIHAPVAGLLVEFNEQVLDVLAGRPPGSRDVFDCMSRTYPPYLIHRYVSAERDRLISAAAEPSVRIDPEARALAERCGARPVVSSADLERLAAFENDFQREHRERLDGSLATVDEAIESAVEILSAPLEAVRR